MICYSLTYEFFSFYKRRKQLFLYFVLWYITKFDENNWIMNINTNVKTKSMQTLRIFCIDGYLIAFVTHLDDEFRRKYFSYDRIVITKRLLHVPTFNIKRCCWIADAWLKSLLCSNWWPIITNVLPYTVTW